VNIVVSIRAGAKILGLLVALDLRGLTTDNA
jgi:hypothetical protein